MENKQLKFGIIYLIDTGAPRSYIVNELIQTNNILTFYRPDFLDFEKIPTEDEVNKVIDELLLSEEIIYDLKNDVLYVTEFMPHTASKITGKNYTKENVKKTYDLYRS